MFGSFLPSARSSTKAYSGRGSRHCYAITWFHFPISPLIEDLGQTSPQSPLRKSAKVGSAGSMLVQLFASEDGRETKMPQREYEPRFLAVDDMRPVVSKLLIPAIFTSGG